VHVMRTTAHRHVDRQHHGRQAAHDPKHQAVSRENPRGWPSGTHGNYSR
jgi:hypothetical protein